VLDVPRWRLTRRSRHNRAHVPLTPPAARFLRAVPRNVGAARGAASQLQATRSTDPLMASACSSTAGRARALEAHPARGLRRRRGWEVGWLRTAAEASHQRIARTRLRTGRQLGSTRSSHHSSALEPRSSACPTSTTEKRSRAARSVERTRTGVRVARPRVADQAAPTFDPTLRSRPLCRRRRRHGTTWLEG